MRSEPAKARDRSSRTRNMLRRVQRCLSARWFLLFFSLSLICGAQGQQRFPPPEFETGHKLPTTSVPAARGLLFEYLDVFVLAACLGAATWLVYRKRSRKGVVALSLFSLAYFGFWRKGCIC